jgi:hypothetical protein
MGVCLLLLLLLWL